MSRMHARTILFGATGLALATLATTAAATENDPGASVTTHVDSIMVRQADGPAVIDVWAEGGKYDTAADKFLMHYDASVSCKGLWDVHYFEVAVGPSQNWYDVKGKNYQHKPIGDYTDLLASWNVDTQDKSRSRSGRTLVGPMKAKLRELAIDRCNDESERIAQRDGISLPQAMSTERSLALSKSGWITSNMQLQAWTSCGAPQDQLTWLSVFDGPPDIVVRCKARARAPGVDTSGLPGQLAAPFQVTKLALSALPTNHRGECPVQVKLTGTVTANKAGSTRYRWKIGNSLSIESQLTFEGPGSRQVHRTIDVDHDWDPTITLLSSAAGDHESNAVDVHVQCVTPRVPGPGGLAPPMPPKPPTPPRPLAPPPQAPSGKADLVPGPTLSVGNASAAWGHTLTVNASKSQLPMQGNACGLTLSYQVRNVGAGPAGGFASRLSTPQKTLHTGQVAGLAAGAAKTVTGVLYLPEGDYDASVAVDSQGQVAEGNEANNGATVRLKVRNCGGPGH